MTDRSWMICQAIGGMKLFKGTVSRHRKHRKRRWFGSVEKAAKKFILKVIIVKVKEWCRFSSFSTMCKVLGPLTCYVNFLSNSDKFGQDHKTIIDEKVPSHMRKCTCIALLLIYICGNRFSYSIWLNTLSIPSKPPFYQWRKGGRGRGQNII
jgi:hypothetical protein